MRSAAPTRSRSKPRTTAAIEITDGRSARQRAADALGIIARIALESGKAGSRGGEAPRIVIHTDLPALMAARQAQGQPPSARQTQAPAEPVGQPAASAGPAAAGELAVFGSGDPVDPDMLGRMACDALLQRALLAPSGPILDLGRDVRTATPAQRRALNARDQGCVIPGCTAPAAWCDAHHVQWWSDSGRTDLDNLALVCGRHHTEIHQRIWALEIRDGLPWVIPPPWIDEGRRPLRNTWRDDARTAHRLGTQLRLGLDPPDETPPKAA